MYLRDIRTIFQTTPQTTPTMTYTNYKEYIKFRKMDHLLAIVNIGGGQYATPYFISRR